MPELPEVEAARKLAQEHLVGKRIVKVTAVSDDVGQAGIPASLPASPLSTTLSFLSRKRWMA